MNEPLIIKVKYHTDIDPLQQIAIGDAIDVRAAENIDLKYMQSAIIPLGFSCQLPKGYFALLLPRSSTFKRWGIIESNSAGLIDESFCGDSDQWGMPVVALRNDVHIKKNERIGQFIILPKMPIIQFETVNSLGNENRNGFGSTGAV
jgi:dUTP pyrophosphatase